MCMTQKPSKNKHLNITRSICAFIGLIKLNSDAIMQVKSNGYIH